MGWIRPQEHSRSSHLLAGQEQRFSRAKRQVRTHSSNSLLTGHRFSGHAPSARRRSSPSGSLSSSSSITSNTSFPSTRATVRHHFTCKRRIPFPCTITRGTERSLTARGRAISLCHRKRRRRNAGGRRHSPGYACIISSFPADTLADAYRTKQGQVTCAAAGRTTQGQGLPRLSVTLLSISPDCGTN